MHCKLAHVQPSFAKDQTENVITTKQELSTCTQCHSASLATVLEPAVKFRIGMTKLQSQSGRYMNDFSETTSMNGFSMSAQLPPTDKCRYLQVQLSYVQRCT